MNRREFFMGATCLALSPMFQPVRLHSAQVTLGPGSMMGTPMRAWVANPAIVKQTCPQWCWAAAASMIFASHQHVLDQTKIVQRVFGSLVCAPAFTTLTMAQVLSSTWTDAFGQQFQSQILAAYDPANGINNIGNDFIITELSQDQPLLYANTHHAMVVTSIDYLATAVGPQVQGVGVLDPFPFSPNFHPLSLPEMVPLHMGGQMTFLAAVRVT